MLKNKPCGGYGNYQPMAPAEAVKTVSTESRCHTLEAQLIITQCTQSKHISDILVRSPVFYRCSCFESSILLSVFLLCLCCFRQHSFYTSQLLHRPAFTPTLSLHEVRFTPRSLYVNTHRTRGTSIRPLGQRPTE